METLNAYAMPTWKASSYVTMLILQGIYEKIRLEELYALTTSSDICPPQQNVVRRFRQPGCITWRIIKGKALGLKMANHFKTHYYLRATVHKHGGGLFWTVRCEAASLYCERVQSSVHMPLNQSSTSGSSTHIGR